MSSGPGTDHPLPPHPRLRRLEHRRLVPRRWSLKRFDLPYEAVTPSERAVKRCERRAPDPYCVRQYTTISGDCQLGRKLCFRSSDAVGRFGRARTGYHGTTGSDDRQIPRGALYGSDKTGSLGSDLLFRPVTGKVPSALEGLTAGFGMGPGVPPPP